MRKCSKEEIGSFRLRTKPEGAGAWRSAEVFFEDGAMPSDPLPSKISKPVQLPTCFMPKTNPQ
jgi:hypothetical protein